MVFKLRHHKHPDDPVKFREIELPQGGFAFVPSDVEIHFPAYADVPLKRLHLLAYTPWHESFLDFVPVQYRAFFRFALPYLNTRTSNVHTALSFSFFKELIDAVGGVPDERLAAIALALHDCGWSTLADQQIADSLDYKSIAFTPKAAKAKRLHTENGSELARRLLDQYRLHPPLTSDQVQFVCDVIYFHERIHDFKINGETPKEFIVVCEADRLWPFTYENFWLDTIRKGVDPHIYIHNVERAIDSDLLLTDFGRHKTRAMVAQRKKEVQACPVSHHHAELLELNAK